VPSVKKELYTLYIEPESYNLILFTGNVC